MFGEIFEIAPQTYWVGIKDWNRRVFDSLIPLPNGTTYNAYLIPGKDKNALVDTVNPGFESDLLGKISRVLDPSKIDYLIMNHAEPDHAGAIPTVLQIARDAKLVLTAKGAEMAKRLYRVSDERMLIVKEGDFLDLGGRTLRFIEAPFLHWPETMFTYFEEEKVLFPCDFFGAHYAGPENFDDEMGELLIHEAKRYYAEIMMPFKPPVSRALEKISKIEIEIIAPSHGPIYRNPKRIVDAYAHWVGGPLENKVVVIYASMWKNTEKMVKALMTGVAAKGVKAVLFDLVVADVGNLARELVDAKAVAIGVPTFVGGPHPFALYATALIKALRPRLKVAVVFGTYGWGGGGVRQIKEMLEASKFEVISTHEVMLSPFSEDIEKMKKMGEELAEKVKSL